MRFWIVNIIAVLVSFGAFSQQDFALIKGKVKDSKDIGIGQVNISIIDSDIGTTTDSLGAYSLRIPAGKEVFIEYSHLSYAENVVPINLKKYEIRMVNVRLIDANQVLDEVLVEERLKGNNIEILKIDPGNISTVAGSFESMLSVIAIGTSSNNELSSNYSVRGGNYDENLIYVNDIEIYRPFLVRSGQQEGLSFINSDLISNIQFSAGGFEARYGDKMSSVLDIEYRKPTSFRGSFGASLLGGSMHLEGRSKKGRFTYLTGSRYKTNQYILGSLDTKGDYRPSFADAQAILDYRLSDKVSIEWLGHYSNNNYNFVPNSRETKFGTINEALKLRIFFEGQEANRFETYTSALALNWKLNDGKGNIKWISSFFRSYETENFDILGEYWLDELNTDLGSDDFGETSFNRGVGGYLNHARNELDFLVYNSYLKGKIKAKNGLWQFGAKIQKEQIEDKISEWNLIDSSGFSIPHNTFLLDYDRSIDLFHLLNTSASLSSNRITGYTQRSWFIDRSKKITLEDTTFNSESHVSFTLGARANHWSYNNELLISPRASLHYKPHWFKMKDGELHKTDIKFRLSTGVYYQPPLYRELRNLSGVLNPEIRAQRSIHLVLGTDINMKLMNKPFKFVAEAYYKFLNDLIPYDIDNVRIRYHATNNSNGYARGLDLKLNGEFIKGLESHVSISYLKTEEDLVDDFYYELVDTLGVPIPAGANVPSQYVDSVVVQPGFIRRPADQRISFGLFFQDEMPQWPSYKVHLNLVFGSGLPFGPPNGEKYQQTGKLPSYKRVDIGFSKDLITDKSKNKKFIKNLETFRISLDVFNLLAISNTVSKIWVRDISGQLYGVPNFLTSRRVNLKLYLKF